jgi:HK97 family phage major capsid protein
MIVRTIEEIQAAMNALLTAAEGRTLTDDEVTQYEALEAELVTTQRTMQIQQRNAAYNMPTGAPTGTPVAGPVGVPRQDEGLENAFRAYLMTGQPNADLAELRGPSMAQGSSVGSEGGYLVPPGFRAKIVERMKAFGGIANVCDQLNTTTGNNIDWPTIDDTSNVAEVVGESAAPANQNGLVFGKKELRAYTYQTGGPSSAPIKLPRELIQDQAFDLEGRLARLLGIRLARARAADLANGNGVGKPLGLVYGLTGIEPAADTAGITYDDLLTFIHSVDPAYRESGKCRWVFNDTSLKTIRQIKDSNGDPMWRSMTSTMGDAPGTGTLLDFPYTIDQGMPDIDIDNNTVNWGAFGDIEEGYVLRTVRGIEVVVNPWSSANTREIEYTAWMRADATQQNTAAYVALCGEQ